MMPEDKNAGREKHVIGIKYCYNRVIPGQLSLLPSAVRGMSTSQNAVMLCGWGVKAGMVHFNCR